LVAQALRAAAPAAGEAAARPQSAQAPAAPARGAAAAAAPVAPAAAGTPSAPRETLIARARAVFRIAEGPTLAELTAAQATTEAPAAAAMPDPAQAFAAAMQMPAEAFAPTPASISPPTPAPAPVRARPESAPAAAATAPVAPAPASPAVAAAPSRFDEMMAALDAGPRRSSAAGATDDTRKARAAATDGDADDFVPLLPDNIPMPHRPGADDEAPAAPMAAPRTAASFVPDPPEWMPVPAAPVAPATAAASANANADREVEVEAPAPRALQAVAVADTDPAIAAMRDEVARMRQMMETQLEQLSLERLRGAPARAAVLDALAGYGCEESLARAVAERIDPRLPPGEVQAPMLAELARMLTVLHSEPLEDGG